MNLALSDKRSRIGFSFAWNGVRAIIKQEFNFRIHLGVMIFILILGILLRLSIVEWLFIIVAIGFVLITEIMNTVTEELIDYLNPAIHPKAKIIKDMAAGAVLIASITAALIGVLIFGSKLTHLL